MCFTRQIYYNSEDKNMKEFIMNNLSNIITAVLFVALIIVLWFAWRGKYRDKAKQMLLSLVIAAEEKYGGGTGELKFAYVAERLYEVMPGIFQVFFAAEDIAGWIEDAVTKMKEYLSENENVAALMGGKK